MITNHIQESHRVFDHRDFTEAFKNDLRNAKALVLIHSPFLTTRRIEELRQPIESCLRRNVRVCVFVQKLVDPTEDARQTRDSAIRLLKSLGVHVVERPFIHEKLAVIDDCIFWEGSLNILSYRNTSERMTRWLSRKKVEEAMTRHKLQCKTCSDNAYPFGAVLANRRTSLGLSQVDLALKTKVSRTVISTLEIGKRDIKLSTLLRIHSELRLGFRSVPLHLLPTIDDLITRCTDHVE